MMIWNFLTAIALILSPVQGQAEEGKKAWIEVTEEGRLVTIKVFSDLGTGVGGTYSLEVIKAGPGGRSVNRQKGAVPIMDAPAERSLSVSKVSVEPSAKLDVVLMVEDDLGHVYEDGFSKDYE